MYMNLEKSMCRELEALEEKYRNGQEMNEGDIRRIDLLSHALKSMAAYKSMKNNHEENQYQGNSYMNNSYANNPYARREMDNRYPNQSGYYPYPAYPEERRW